MDRDRAETQETYPLNGATPPNVVKREAVRAGYVCRTCGDLLAVVNASGGTFCRDLCTRCEASELLQQMDEEALRRHADREPPICERTSALLRGFKLLLEHHKMPYHLIVDLKRQIRSHLDTSPAEDVWLGRAKSLLAAPLAGYLKCEAPPKADVEFQFRGRVRLWFRNRQRVFNRKNTHLWFSWFQLKRCAMQCSKAFVEETYKDHLKSLTSPDVGEDSVIDSIFEDRTFMKVLDACAVGIERRLADKSWLDSTPSKNACFERTRKHGGQQDELRQQVGLKWCLKGTTELDRMIIVPHIHDKKGGLQHNCVVEVRRPYGCEEWRELDDKDYIDGRPRARAKIQIVLEPLKGRVISKGEALLYSKMRPLQKAMHTTLRYMPCFKLIGRSMTSTDLVDLVSDIRPDDGWLSIDYKAATDALSWKYSGRILRKIVERLSPQDQQDAERCLGPHDLWYPDDESPGEYTFGGVQTSGQLMGSILSFPILCLANLGVYLLNTAERQRGWSYKERLSAVLVNGDDMLYVGSKADYARHTDLSGRVGLKMSVGKAYWHQAYANINSESFHYDLNNVEATPWKVPFLNTGLYFGAHKVLRKENTAAAHMGADDSLVGNLNLILAGTLPGRQSEILSRFLSLHSEAVKKECQVQLGPRCYRSRNLFLPLTMGGMGVLPPIGFKYRINSVQRRLARYYREQYMYLSIQTQPPFPEGYIVPKVERWVNKPWLKKALLPADSMLGGLDYKKSETRRIMKFCQPGRNLFTDLPGVMIA